jgi:GNAT superfamily N-acetyltransferase
VIRALTDRDLAALLQLSASAGWNQTPLDWQRLLQLSNCFGLVKEDHLAASIAVTCYGRDLAWIGMVLTLPEHRGNGYASQLMKHAMDFALGCGIACIKLDATDLGAPVYRKFGFVDECPVERWRSSAATRSERQPAAPEVDWTLDRQAFGADRRALIESFADLCTDAAGGYICRRPGSHAFQLGPCVASNAQTVGDLVAWAASQGPTMWDLFPGNAKALDIAHRNGFAPSRQLLRMSYQGRDLDQNPEAVYALAGFEWG